MSIARLIVGLASGSVLTASASPTTLSASRTGAGSVTTGSTTATPAGGIGPYTYSWSATGLTINSPTSATTTFSRTLGSGEDTTIVATCAITDTGTGNLALTSVSVHLVSAAPDPPVWNISNGENVGTFPRGGTTQVIDVYATCASGVSYSILSQFSYPTGFGPVASLSSGAGGPGSGHVQGAASSGCTPGDYSATLSALNPADGSSSSVAVYITVT